MGAGHLARRLQALEAALRGEGGVSVREFNRLYRLAESGRLPQDFDWDTLSPPQQWDLSSAQLVYEGVRRRRIYDRLRELSESPEHPELRGFDAYRVKRSPDGNQIESTDLVSELLALYLDPDEGAIEAYTAVWGVLPPDVLADERVQRALAAVVAEVDGESSRLV